MNSFYPDCEQELLHLSGAIQPFGCLLAGETDNYLITFVSANTQDFIGVSPRQVLGKVLFEFFPDIKYQVSQQSPRKVLTGFLQTEKSVYDGVLQCSGSGSGSGWILEIVEHIEKALPYGSDVSNRVKLLHFQNIVQHSQSLVEHIQNLTQFERVLVYQFREDGSGEVIAETVRDCEDVYLNLRFPAADVPQIARNLYQLNPYRSIPNVYADPVPIIALQPEKELDLSYCDLRSVSPVHLEYLKNMNVSASLSFSVQIKNELWGLVTCHSLKPTDLSFSHKELCALLVRNYAMTLGAYYAEQHLKFINDAEKYTKLFTLLFNSANNHERAELLQEIMHVMRSGGMVYYDGVQQYSVGEVPTPNMSEKIANWASRHVQQTGVYYTDRLAEIFLETKSIQDKASGLVFIQAGADPVCWFAWFRPEWPHVINWAGNPNKNLDNHQEQALRPRTSFKRWQQEMRGVSMPWDTQEIMLAKRFRFTLMQLH